MNAVVMPLAARAINLIVLHCSATPSGRWIGGLPRSDSRPLALETIDLWHASRGFLRSPAARARFNGAFGSIGYHYVLDLDGFVHSGRALAEQGAHAAGFNAHSVGVCLVGGAERDARYTEQQWRSLATLVQQLCATLQLPLQAPLYPRQGMGICGHRDLSPDANSDGRVSPSEWLKTCPGFDVSAWLAAGMSPRPEQLCEVPR